jgi:hypothetical protein
MDPGVIDVTLIGGPAAGVTLELGAGTASLLVEGHGLPPEVVALYTRTGSPFAFRFAGLQPARPLAVAA